MTIINVCDRNPASVLIINAMALIEKDGEFQRKFVGDGGPNCEVKLTVNGHEVDVVTALADAWKRIEARVDERAREMAVEMIRGAQLADLLQAIQNAEWQIQDALRRSPLADAAPDRESENG
jgi:hypothetical protein